MGFIRSDWTRVSAAALVAALLLATAPNMAWADDMGGGGFAVPSQQYGETESMRYHFGYGVSAMLASLIYGPIKTGFALTGLAAGGVAYAFTLGDTATARSVAGPAVTGDYVLTPAHMKGDTPVDFIGDGPF